MRASNFLSTRNWTWLSVVVVSLFLNDSVTCSDGKEDYVSSHFDSLNCMMAEGGNNEDKQECNPMQAINRPVSFMKVHLFKFNKKILRLLILKD